MLLEDKNAVIYGWGNAIRGAVGRACAREQAKVSLDGRTVAPRRAVGEYTSEAGGVVETAWVDALDEQAIPALSATVSACFSSTDISFNATGMGDVQVTPLVEMSLQDFAFLVMTCTSNLPLDTIDVGRPRTETEERR